MAEPKLDMGDWVGIVGLIGAGVGSVMALFRSSNIERDKRIKNVEDEMKEFTVMHAEHNTQLAVIENCQMNTASTLIELKGLHADMNKKLDDVLKEIRKS